mmetsp:Transcript_10704/g.37023  ORF Transcript_10704/g.37023 Transcript_10704/m.37023 type:complete len:236 (-) Transcript_10704:368-1075(-)
MKSLSSSFTRSLVSSFCKPLACHGSMNTLSSFMSWARSLRTPSKSKGLENTPSATSSSPSSGPSLVPDPSAPSIPVSFPSVSIVGSAGPAGRTEVVSNAEEKVALVASSLKIGALSASSPEDRSLFHDMNSVLWRIPSLWPLTASTTTLPRGSPAFASVATSTANSFTPFSSRIAVTMSTSLRGIPQKRRQRGDPGDGNAIVSDSLGLSQSTSTASTASRTVPCMLSPRLAGRTL